MKYITTLCLALSLAIAMVGCGKEAADDPPSVTMNATILEIHEGYYLVEPVAGSNELNSCDRLTVSMKNIAPSPEPCVGDVIQVVYDGQIQETYPGRIPTPTSITVVEQAERPKGGNWGITLSAEDVTPTGMTLVITQSGGEPTGELAFGSDYCLEMLTDDVWEPVPYAVDGDNLAWTAEAYIVAMEGTTESVLDWEYLYGSLEPGKYRLMKSFMDFRGTGDYSNQNFFMEFEVK